MKKYYRKEVLEHNKPGNYWIIINNIVYNISDFIDNHPGGSDILESRAGGDATSFFVTKHYNNENLIKQLSKYKIGEIIESERVNINDNKEPFLIELIEKCFKEKLYKSPTWRKNPFFFMRIFNIIAFFLLSLIALYANIHWSISLLLVFVQALIGTSIFGLVAHEATHRNFPKNKLLKKVLTYSWPIFWPFIVKNPLRFEHNSHHIKIGDPEFDYEVAGFAALIRFSGTVKHTFFHKFQHKLARYFYPFYGNIITTIGAYHSQYWNKHKREDLSEQSLSLMITAIYYIFIPSIMHGSVLWFILLYLVYQCTLFYGIYIGAAINHFVPSIMSPIPPEHKNKYGYYICHNTTNFSTKNKLWLWYTGGFNIQIEHHLIPFIPVDNLNKMVPIVKALCEKHNYPYKEYPDFKTLWKDHYSYLQELSVDELTNAINTEIHNKKAYQAR